MTRREFVTAAGAAVAAPLAAAAPAGSQFKKSIWGGMFPRQMPYAECFRQAKNAGFEGVEFALGRGITLDSPPDEVKRVGEAAHQIGVGIPSMGAGIGSTPLNSPDPEVRARGVAALEKTIEFATYLDCGSILLVPGRLGSGARFEVGYETTWERFTVEIRKAIPAAERAKVVLAPENVWNKFLVSPLEMRSFVDQFHSPWLKTHFDVGNVMQYGYPQDWILTLGPRISRVHFKDYKLSTGNEQGRFVDLLEGDVDWKAVMAALVKVGYRSFVSPEYTYDPKNPEYLKKISLALDKILAMA